jgi:hypothetical protein
MEFEFVRFELRRGSASKFTVDTLSTGGTSEESATIPTTASTIHNIPITIPISEYPFLIFRSCLLICDHNIKRPNCDHNSAFDWGKKEQDRKKGGFLSFLELAP